MYEEFHTWFKDDIAVYLSMKVTARQAKELLSKDYNLDGKDYYAHLCVRLKNAGGGNTGYKPTGTVYLISVSDRPDKTDGIEMLQSIDELKYQTLMETKLPRIKRYVDEPRLKGVEMQAKLPAPRKYKHKLGSGSGSRWAR